MKIHHHTKLLVKEALSQVSILIVTGPNFTVCVICINLVHLHKLMEPRLCIVNRPVSVDAGVHVEVFSLRNTQCRLRKHTTKTTGPFTTFRKGQQGRVTLTGVFCGLPPPAYVFQQACPGRTRAALAHKARFAWVRCNFATEKTDRSSFLTPQAGHPSERK